MATYLISFIVSAIILSCFYGKKSYDKRFIIVCFSAMFSLIPLTIANGIANNHAEREVVLTKTQLLEPIGHAIDSLAHDTFMVYIVVSDGYMKFLTESVEEKRLEDMVIHYIQPDSLNKPRYEVTRERIKPSSEKRWFSKKGIPDKNRLMHIYLPNDTNMRILNLAVNENKKTNSD